MEHASENNQRNMPGLGVSSYEKAYYSYGFETSQHTSR
jgi:hypothetical protein